MAFFDLNFSSREVVNSSNGPLPREAVCFDRSRVFFWFEVVFFGEMHCPKLISESRKTKTISSSSWTASFRYATEGAARATVLKVTQAEPSRELMAWQALADGYALKSSNDPATALQPILATPKRCKDAKEL